MISFHRFHLFDHKFVLASALTVKISLYEMAVVVVVLLVIFIIKPGTSQSTNTERNINTPIRSFCGRYPPLPNFISNRNSTLAAIRRQLLNKGVFYATAKSLADGDDSVFGAAQCRKYLPTAQCVACFDAGMSVLVSCITGNGAYVFFDNSFVRYQSSNFIDNPNVVDDGEGLIPRLLCGNQSATQPTTIFKEAVKELLSDIKVATPKTSDFYVASTRQINSENVTLYAISQCVEHTNQVVCKNCTNSAYDYLNRCIPNATEGRYFDIGCFARYSVTPFFNSNQKIHITNLIKVHSSSRITQIAGATAGGVGLVLIMIVFLSLFLLRKKSKNMKEDALDTPDLKGAINYSYEDLQLATNNFGEDTILGKGGFGEVFKAVLDDENIVAVKRIKVGSAKEREDFENEVKLISNVHHRNILRLLGWSSEGSHLLLVLDYMPNGSLDKFLWGIKQGTLNWKQRYDIIFGIAKGLAHLHNEFHLKIIHRDIKSNNILLDHNFQPKIADFGLARLHPDDQSHVSTKFAGTLGYTAPEYALRGILSDKVDTYSFGIVVLEIISGRRCTDITSDRLTMDYLLEHAWKLYENRKHIKLIDETMDANDGEHVVQIIEIALMCTQSPASKRPTMSEVVLMLSKRQSLGNGQLTRPILMKHDRRFR